MLLGKAFNTNKITDMCSPALKTNSHQMEIIEPSHLISINNDCKMQIFEYLEYRDMINIAETSKQLHTAVHGAFKRKFAKGRLTIVPEIEQHLVLVNFVNVEHEDQAPNIRVWTKLLILKLLRNFGNIVSHIFLIYQNEYQRLPFGCHIENYMAEYCSKMLTKLTLVARPKFLFNRRPQVQAMILEKILNEPKSLSELLFNEYFPNLYRLSLHTNSYTCTGVPRRLSILDVTIKLPSLKQLNIFLGDCGIQCYCEDVVRLLRLNPELLTLKLQHASDKCPIELVQRVRDYLPKLEALTLRTKACPVTYETFHFKNVVDFTLDLHDNCKRIPFTFNKLNRFHVNCCAHPIKQCIADFLLENEHLKILHLDSARNVSSLSEMIFALSNIEHLTITDYSITISSEVVLRLLREIPFLKMLTLVGVCYNPAHFNELVKAKISNLTKSDGQFYVTFTQ